MCRLNARTRSHGSSFKKRTATSKVAPPHISMLSYPISSIRGRMGSISSVVIRVANRDCCPSRKLLFVSRTNPHILFQLISAVQTAD